MPVFKEAGGNINDWYVWGIDVSYIQRKGRDWACFFFRKGCLELLGVQLCGFSEVTSGLVIGFFFFFLASNSFSISGERGLSVIQFTS